jgi:hypothetical protein
MLRFIYQCALISITISKSFEANAQLNTPSAPLLDAKDDWQIVQGKITDNLQPCAWIGREGIEWSLSLELSAYGQTDFQRFPLLEITNRVGSKLELWQTNGVPVVSTNVDVLAAFNLPKQATVSEIMRGMPLRRSALYWWRGSINPRVKMMPFTTIWSLQSYFDISPTNDYVLQITPLIYKVETNEVTAHLVEFSPIKVKLLANGNVQKLSN